MTLDAGGESAEGNWAFGSRRPGSGAWTAGFRNSCVVAACPGMRLAEEGVRAAVSKVAPQAHAHGPLRSVGAGLHQDLAL